MARAIWSGHISFGMVNIPIKLFTAVRDQSIHLHMLSEDGTCRLRRKLYCPETGQEYDFKSAARGYEIAPGQYVILREEEMQRLQPEKGRTIEITAFVDEREIDPLYYERPYYLLPDGPGLKGYHLLMEAMRSRGKVGLAKFVMRSKEYLAALRPGKDIITLETMHFQNEVVAVGDDIEPPQRVEPAEKEQQVAEKLIDALTEAFDPSQYEDTYTKKLQELVEAKAEGKEDVVLQAAEEPAPPQVINLMEALERSLASTGHGGEQEPAGRGRKTTKKTSKKAPRRRKSA